MLNRKNIPYHVAIIMDGNGRWARERGLPRSAGHRAGIKSVKEIVRGAAELGIKIITLYVFSMENWNRPKREINILMRTFSRFLDEEVDELNRNDIRLRVIGREEPVPSGLLAKIKQAEELTAENNTLTVVLAFNYGGRTEIVDAAVKFTRAVQEGVYSINQLSEKTFSQFLYAPDLPPPDLIIRTSGELRVSNFLLWQLAYAELYFVEKYWPAFTKKDLIRAISEYQRRERRFGHI